MNNWLIDNVFIACGQGIYRQCKGIPMGFSCSPLWCNLYLAFFELCFCKRLAHLGKWDILQYFNNVMRYYDDLLLINVPNPTIFFNCLGEENDSNPFWIYPKQFVTINFSNNIFLNLPPHHFIGRKTSFLNMEFSIDLHKPHINIRLFDKRKLLPFQPIQFIHRSGNRPQDWAHKVIISLITPYLYATNSPSSAADSIRNLIKLFTKNGFEKAKLWRMVSRALNKDFPLLLYNIDDVKILLSIKTTGDLHEAP